MGCSLKCVAALCGSMLCLLLLACGGGPPLIPDFTLSASPAAIKVTPGSTQSVTLSVVGVNGFTGSVAVTATGLPTGVAMSPSTPTIAAGATLKVIFTASGNAASGTAPLTLSGQSGALTHATVVALTILPAPQPPDVATYHYDNARDGLNAAEIALGLSNVSSSQFGKIGFDQVDGAVDAEPLYIANLEIGGKQRNVLYVGTEHDSVYAFDADSGGQLWMTSTLGSNETTSDDRSCSAWTPEIGITATPVIDRKQGPNGTIFVVGMSKDANGGYHHRLHGLDLITGREVSGSPTEISATFPGAGGNSQGGQVTFDPSQYAERAALLLVNGTLYLGWTSFCDQQPYSGWVMGYSESTLKQTRILNLTPNGSGGAIWMSGGGMAADSAGNIYLADGNGSFDQNLDANGFPTSRDFGNSMLKLSATGTLAVADYFAPCNTADENNKDWDIGAGGVMLLPDVQDATGAVRHLMIVGGKDYNVYLGDRDNLGKFNSNCSNTSNVRQILAGTLGGQNFTTPAYFNGTLYYGASDNVLRALPVTDALVQPESSQTATTFGYPGATATVSANGVLNGIVWSLESTKGIPAVLHAYDASNLANELYNSQQAPKNRDSLLNGNKYITPMVVNGKVYVGTPAGVVVFGLLRP